MTTQRDTPPLPPLYGLVLAGGTSSRMQRDKATLEYHGRPQLEWSYELLLRRCRKAFISVRPDQSNDALRSRFPQIVDTVADAGPLAGLAAALARYPAAAWLVLACDLPFVTPAVLDRLIAARDGTSLATAFRSAHDGLPEPLCAIYEPAIRTAVSEALTGAHPCPRKLLIRLGVPLLEPAWPAALDNVNTPDEFKWANAALAAGAADRRA